VSRTLRPLQALQPRRCVVGLDPAGRPRTLDAQPIDAIREEWRVEQGWWSEPYRRRYCEIVLHDGRLCVIYEDRREPGSWWRHGR